MITEQYILMCKGAKELQEAWEPKPGDLVDGRFGFYHLPTEFIEKTVKHMYYWLPRQEDLQEISMLQLEIDTEVMIFIHFKDWALLNHIIHGKTIFTSLNEYWLGFLMQMVYGKQWNGKTWEAMASEN